MFSQLSEKMRTALLFAIGMGCFLFMGSLVYFYPKSQFTDQGTINKTSDPATSIDRLYRDLTETGSGNRVSMVNEISQYDPHFASAKQTEVDDRWFLYVTGSVETPGVYRLPEGARVFELVNAAGGFTIVADAVAVNMAARLQDGDHLHVPQIGDNGSVSNRNLLSTGGNSGTVVFAQSGQIGSATVKNQRTNNGNNPLNSPKIDINTASTTELQTLPGIGPAMSVRIIQYRNQNGRFKRVADLINVSGIGAKKLEAIEPLIYVR